MKKKLTTNLIGILLLSSCFLFTAYMLFLPKEETSKQIILNDNFIHTPKEEVDSPKSNVSLYVDIKGAIVSPGVYMVKENARMKDLIMLAGGFKEEADEKQINLASLLHDEQLVYIPSLGEKDQMNTMNENENASKKININQATVVELELLPGIGPAKASEIIRYRQEVSKFKTKEDLLKVSGIGDRSFQLLKEYISVY